MVHAGVVSSAESHFLLTRTDVVGVVAALYDSCGGSSGAGQDQDCA